MHTVFVHQDMKAKVVFCEKADHFPVLNSGLMEWTLHWNSALVKCRASYMALDATNSFPTSLSPFWLLLVSGQRADILVNLSAVLVRFLLQQYYGPKWRGGNRILVLNNSRHWFLADWCLGTLGDWELSNRLGPGIQDRLFSWYVAEQRGQVKSCKHIQALYLWAFHDIPLTKKHHKTKPKVQPEVRCPQ